MLKGINPLYALLVLGMLSRPLSAAEPEAVTLQLKWTHQFQFAGYYAAQYKGYYAAAGLDVTIVEAGPGVDVVEEVLAGRAQFGVGTSELVLNRYHGAPVVVLGVVFQHSPLNLATLASSGIDNIHKLADRSVMIEPGSAELFAYLSKEGIDEQALKLVEHSFDVADLVNGKVDAMSVYSTHEVFQLRRLGIPYHLFTPRMNAIDFYGDNFFTLESELSNHPERVAAFRDATQRGWAYAMANPAEIIQLIRDEYSSPSPRAQLEFEAEVMADLMQPELIEPGYMTEGRWQHIASTYHELGLLPENFDVTPMLFAPPGAFDLGKIRTQLSLTLAGMAVLGLLSLVVFRLYRKSRINADRLATMFEFAPLSVVVLDEHNRVLIWNGQAEKTFQWSAAQVVGRNMLDFIVAPAQRSAVEQVFAEVYQQRGSVRNESLNLKRDGSEILCEWMNAPFKDPRNKTTYLIAMAQDITEQKRMAKQLEDAAHYDNLTGLPNRALILELLRQSLATARRQQRKLALLFLDLDGLKLINDNLGHIIGDAVLKTTARRLQQEIRDCDYAGRLAGDEFLVVLQDTDTREHAGQVAAKLKARVQEVIAVDNCPGIRTSVSVGISLYPDDATEVEELIHRADQLMYHDKQKRR